MIKPSADSAPLGAKKTAQVTGKLIKSNIALRVATSKIGKKSYAAWRQKLATSTAHSTIALIRKGVNAGILLDLADHLGMTRAKVYAVAGLPSATAERKIREDALLSPETTERIVRIAKVETEALVVFGQDDRVRQWLCTPSSIFAGEAPMDFIDTDIGTQEVLKSITAIRYGGVA